MAPEMGTDTPENEAGYRVAGGKGVYASQTNNRSIGTNL